MNAMEAMRDRREGIRIAFLQAHRYPYRNIWINLDFVPPLHHRKGPDTGPFALISPRNCRVH
jgi:hypothetical protein